LRKNRERNEEWGDLAYGKANFAIVKSTGEVLPL